MPVHGDFSLDRARDALGITSIRGDGFIRHVPFCAGDTTAGTETELQVAVIGDRADVDLPITIESSNYFKNIRRIAQAGEASMSAVTELEKLLADNPERVWENSWVRFPLSRLTDFARHTLQRDLLSDKSHGSGCVRSDVGKFLVPGNGEQYLRTPISYLVKLALADVLGSQPDLSGPIHHTGLRAMEHLVNDNTSPETFSFNVVALDRETGFGRALAKETAVRFLLTHLLTMYANEQFGLTESGQEALIYFSPHPPLRQKRLNDCISDSFYRELFMSPCLSGWNDGQSKYNYMCLCHQVLSRSRLNATAKLRDAGIITRNIVVLPTLSNISLANNGTHISIGSSKLTRLREEDSSDYDRCAEKHIGDLVTKVAEHFLPLFVGTYSAAPYRFDFSDFHPENVLGFLPHELDFTHLRMIWRRWKKKAHLNMLGRSLTPFGLRSVDHAISRLTGIKGDFIPDFRLVDYPVALMSTEQSSALDGTLGNHNRVKKDLADLGIFDENMALYIPYRLREHAMSGFSGFEGRHYSLFENLASDLSYATNLQTLVTAVAFKLVIQGKITHDHIPSSPFIESEVRQIFFGCAIGLPTFFIRQSTENHFLKSILARTRDVRYSRRYPGYLRVYHRRFLLALIDYLRTEGEDIIEMLGLSETIRDLTSRIERPEHHSAQGKLTAGILSHLSAKSPMHVKAEEFNSGAERYYREVLRSRHLMQSIQFMSEDFAELESEARVQSEAFRSSLRNVLDDRSAVEFLGSCMSDLLDGTAPADVLRKLINLVLLTIHCNGSDTKSVHQAYTFNDHNVPSICGAINRQGSYGAAVPGPHH